VIVFGNYDLNSTYIFNDDACYRNILISNISKSRFSVDKRIFLIGYGVYGSMQKPAIYDVTMELIHTASGKVIAKNTTSFSCDGSKYTYRIMFKELAEILPNTIYTASATFKVCDFVSRTRIF